MINIGSLATAAFLSYSSWGEFYLDMSTTMELNNRLSSSANDLLNSSAITSAVGVKSQRELDQYKFAIELAIAYDRVIRGGRTLSAFGGTVGGLKGGNLIPMAITLCLLIKQVKSLKTSPPLLDLVGSGVQAYWLGAQLQSTSSPSPSMYASMPKFPMIGGIQNIPPLLNGSVLFPGVWTPIPLLTVNDSPYAWLFNFMLSANLHLLTVSGIMSSNVTYPPPAPPAPGILPWVGYFVNPLPPIPSASILSKLTKNPTFTQRALVMGQRVILKTIVPMTVKTIATLGPSVLTNQVTGKVLDTQEATVISLVDKVDKAIGDLPVELPKDAAVQFRTDIGNEIEKQTGFSITQQLVDRLDAR